MDKIDLHVEGPLVAFKELSSGAAGEKSSTIRERVVQARHIQGVRFKKSANATNSALEPRQVKTHCKLDSESAGDLEHALAEPGFSARTHNRILKVARTLADLAGSNSIRPADILEAIQYRSLDRKLLSLDHSDIFLTSDFDMPNLLEGVNSHDDEDSPRRRKLSLFAFQYLGAGHA